MEERGGDVMPVVYAVGDQGELDGPKDGGGLDFARECLDYTRETRNT